jgi:hypothetical protein
MYEGAAGAPELVLIAGDRRSAALRHLSNRFLGQLHHCLATGESDAEDTAWT